MDTKIFKKSLQRATAKIHDALLNYFRDIFRTLSNIEESIRVLNMSLTFGAEYTYTQLAITCLKLTIETLEQSVKYVQS